MSGLSNFNPMQAWAQEIAAKREKLAADALALEAAKQQTMAKKEAGAPDLVSAFNQAYTPQDWLINAAYSQRGNTFSHPNSESGSYSASVKPDANGLLRVNTLSSSDPLFTNGSGAHDAFSTYCILFHGGDTKAALKDAGDNLLTIGSVSYNKAKQTEYRNAVSIPDIHAIDYSTMPEPPQWHESNFSHIEGEGWKKGPKEPFSLDKFSLTGCLDEMRKKMLDDKFVLGQMAIYGQATVFYAPPNAGKTLLTLKLLIDGIESGDITGSDVFYINADDNYKGLVNKLELAEKHGFNMLSPGHNRFESKNFLDHLRQMVKDDSAKGKIIILDTLKKFTELMDKKAASDFMKTGREFIAKGGTLILLAHTNKKRDGEGKVIFGGTSDIVDDADCAYTVDALKAGPFDTTRTVLFENIKSRGDVVRNVGYSYLLQPQSYSELLKSVKPIVEEEAAAAKLRDDFNRQLEKDTPIIEAVVEALDQSITLKTDLIDYVHKTVGSSKKAINTVLRTYDGTSRHKHRWRSLPGEKNAKVYALLANTEPSADDYRRVKNGEY